MPGVKVEGKLHIIWVTTCHMCPWPVPIDFMEKSHRREPRKKTKATSGATEEAEEEKQCGKTANMAL